MSDKGNGLASKARITAIGSYVPERVLTNVELETMLETNDEWIIQRTGIKERRIARPEEFTSHLCIQAIHDLLHTYNQSIEDVDLILVATATPDFPFPSVASRIQAAFDIPNTGAVDISAVCAGFVYGLHLANALITSGLHQKVLVVGGETFSKIMDYTDRTSCILFGDGAGAVLIEHDNTKPSFLSFHLGSKGEGGVHLYQTGLANQMDGKALKDTKCLVQNGREVYKWAVSTVPAGMKDTLAKISFPLHDVDWFIPHSANMRMIESICERSGFPLSKTLTSLEYFGNTSAASIPLALHAGVRSGKVKAGERILLYGFGGGLVHGGLLIEWNI
ncbi:ketoacyl-ACP synthase III [Aneurinibacillus sp. REN35]|uniref:ketoacyl-ACP synthase III n=1 Tax=Aneurinibacillus sp. REN35 TaxID=3237286 RepID=UPI003529D22F